MQGVERQRRLSGGDVGQLPTCCSVGAKLCQLRRFDPPTATQAAAAALIRWEAQYQPWLFAVGCGCG